MHLVKRLFKLHYMSKLMSQFYGLLGQLGASPHKGKQTFMQSTAFCEHFEILNLGMSKQGA